MTLTRSGLYQRIGNRVYALRAPWMTPLWSERNGRLRVIPIWRGWRITVRTISITK